MLVHLVDHGAGRRRSGGELREPCAAELARATGRGLERLPELVVLTKARPGRGRGRPRRRGERWAERLGERVLGVLGGGSSATGEGLDELRRRILAELPEVPPAPGPRGDGPPSGEFRGPSTASTGRPARGGYWVEPRGTRRGAFPGRRSRRVELLFRAPRHQERGGARLPRGRGSARSGVLAALNQGRLRDRRRRSASGEHEFELHI